MPNERRTPSHAIALPLPADATNVAVRYTGEKTLVLEQTAFE